MTKENMITELIEKKKRLEDYNSHRNSKYFLALNKFKMKEMEKIQNIESIVNNPTTIINRLDCDCGKFKMEIISRTEPIVEKGRKFNKWGSKIQSVQTICNSCKTSTFLPYNYDKDGNRIV